MKKIVIVVLVVAFLAVVFCAPQKTNADFLRIHIRANSNLPADQEVKYIVKNAVVEYLAPFLTEATCKQKAIKVVQNRLAGVEQVCNQVLAQQGFDYRCNVKLREESFPDRTYAGVTLPQGVYDALIVELGAAQGNNWWCVVYPPLCFVGGESNGTNVITFKSKLLEIVQQWKNSK